MLISVELSLPRDARFVPILRNVATSLLGDLGVPKDAASDVEIAVSEACANAVRHASGSVDYGVSLAVGAEGCVVEVADHGPGFDPDAVRGEADLDVNAEAGRGLLLIETLVDNCEFIRDDHANRVRLTKRWTADALHFPSWESTSSASP